MLLELKSPRDTNNFSFQFIRSLVCLFFSYFFAGVVLGWAERGHFLLLVTFTLGLPPPSAPQGHLSEGYGKLCSIYLKLLITKMEFHVKVSCPDLPRQWQPRCLLRCCILVPCLVPSGSMLPSLFTVSHLVTCHQMGNCKK